MTQGQWEFDEDNQGICSQPSYGLLIDGASAGVSVEMYTAYDNGIDMDAQQAAAIEKAKFIVRACNAHEEMLKALMAIAEGCSFPADIVQRACRDRARSAIAAAKGETP